MSLFEMRKSAGMTREAVAYRIGVSVSCLQKWEQKGKIPRSSKLKLISELYGVSVNDIIDASKNN